MGHLAQGSTSRVSPNHTTWRGHFNGMVVWQIDENVRGPNILYVCLEFRPMPTSTRITCWVKRKRSESGMSICPGSAYQVDPELMFQPGSGMFGFQKHFAIASISVSLCFPLSLSSNLRVDACRIGTRTRLHLGESSHVQPCPASTSSLTVTSLHSCATSATSAISATLEPRRPAPEINRCRHRSPEMIIHHRQSSSPERSSGTSLSLEAAQDCTSARS